MMFGGYVRVNECSQYRTDTRQEEKNTQRSKAEYAHEPSHPSTTHLNSKSY